MTNQFPPTSHSPARTWVMEDQAAKITGMSLAWFRKKRQTGGGIPYTKMGRNIKYEIADIHAEMMDAILSRCVQDALSKSRIFRGVFIGINTSHFYVTGCTNIGKSCV